LLIQFSCSSNFLTNLGVHSEEKNENHFDFIEDYLKFENYIYSPEIASVQFYKQGFIFSSPIIPLNGNDKLHLAFDDFSGNYKSYKYTVILCDAYWKPVNLNQNQYIEGNFEDLINDYKFSRNTNQKYVHYDLVFPTDYFKISKAANYILKIFTDDEKKSVVITRRFMIYDEKVMIAAKVAKPVKVEYQKSKQSVDFTINCLNYYISNPYRDLKVVIMQNGRWDNAIFNLKPKFIKGEILDYAYEDETTFSGGNEFRSFNIKSIRSSSERVRTTYKDNNGNTHIELYDDERRPYKTYQSKTEIKGKMFIKSDDNITDSDTESDYARVHFFLKYSAPLLDGNIFVLGELTDWNLNANSVMKYSYTQKGYEADLYLKQGYYNYLYVFLENGKTVGDESLVEGAHYETNNDYYIFVYNREAGDEYDKLIAVKQINLYSN